MDELQEIYTKRSSAESIKQLRICLSNNVHHEVINLNHMMPINEHSMIESNEKDLGKHNQCREKITSFLWSGFCLFVWNRCFASRFYPSLLACFNLLRKETSSKAKVYHLISYLVHGDIELNMLHFTFFGVSSSPSSDSSSSCSLNNQLQFR